jgi:hypothetical protein
MVAVGGSVLNSKRVLGHSGVPIMAMITTTRTGLHLPAVVGLLMLLSGGAEGPVHQAQKEHSRAGSSTAAATCCATAAAAAAAAVQWATVPGHVERDVLPSVPTHYCVIAAESSSASNTWHSVPGNDSLA